MITDLICTVLICSGMTVGITARIVKCCQHNAATVCRDKPPLTRNQPSVAGAIKWSRSLFARIKQTMNKLSVIEDEFMQLELGNEVHRQYTSIARQVMTYEKILLKQWVANIDSVAMNYLKMSILARDNETGKIIVNFNKGLVKLMRETRYLDRMGLDIPEIPLNVTLQEESYSKCVLHMNPGILEAFVRVVLTL